jgi:acyl dehydratase
MRVFNDFNDLKGAVGTEVGVSDWMEITQDRINKFAEATGDEQWIHVDTERAARESPSGTTIAHGLLSLSLIPMLTATVLADRRSRLSCARDGDPALFKYVFGWMAHIVQKPRRAGTSNDLSLSAAGGSYVRRQGG